MNIRSLALALTVAATACSGGGGQSREPIALPSPTASGTGSAAEARERLCTRPEPPPPSSAPIEGTTPDYVKDAMSVIEEVRGLTFTDPVVPEAVTRSDLDERLEEGFDAMFPEEFYARRSLAWQTMGAVPEGTDLRSAYHRFFNTAVIGFYDTLSGQLVFLGSDDPSPEERVTLAHELVHALEDQRFDLSRIDRLLADCQEEAFQAALAVIEGSAQYHMVAYANQALTSAERSSLGSGGAAPQVPMFLRMEMSWPYSEGYEWARSAASKGELDAALRDLPTTTEQILHPERTDDLPTPLDVPDFGPSLGTDWTDLDVQDVGESWLWSLLARKVSMGSVDRATDGWDGGLARSWTDGEHVAVVMATAWDSPGDAKEFAAAMERYGSGRPVVVLGPGIGSTVQVLFASDDATLQALRAATA